MGGRRGGRRALTDAQVAAILEWNRNRKTRRQLAAELGVSKGTIGWVICKRGCYKSAPPEARERALRERRIRVERLRARWLL